jgi:hypothetical protein
MAGRTRNTKLGPAIELRARIPGPLFDAASALAEARDISLAELVRQVLARELGIDFVRVGDLIASERREPAA